ncbi:uncharacterized protein MYCFIDRAFT_209870 [Pseudocercospora fijiensis CIRAD86]|uniref:Protein YOP1 n=1 Tax=Pseudocercospora fijiensis (strain CIRAD86) TaxID=383855 RepID=N1QBQ2_PSEFD|nr:uncharacterized protein MYCFIDRAFT_209870 [Pseudocercospora fijiensis CIRAD86]EME88657.1 hypothetical protein MYCFIDRAFT_209870 [Pseudocercospora fijiensis CIRAD86]
MFGFIADILTSIFSVLLPVFFSYKALRTSDPGLLSPWLMYWTTLSIFLVVENQFNFILSWIPFYSWIRLGVHLYLVAPGQQGCVFIYREHIHPFLEEHERQIDRFISDSHAKAKAAGLDAAKQVVEYVKVNVMGMQPRPPTPPPSRNVSYTTQLFNRFAMPSARQGLAAAGTSDIFGLIGKALQQTTYGDAHTTDTQARDLAASGTLIPPNLAGEEREDFVNTQRENLRTLLRAFDTEAMNSADAAASGSQPRSATPRPPTSRKSYLQALETDYMHRSRSESEFEDLGYEPMPDPDAYRPRPDEETRRPPPSRGSTGWSNWIWGNYGEKDSVVDPKKDM